MEAQKNIELCELLERATSGAFADEYTKEDLLRLLSAAKDALRQAAENAADAARMRWMLAGNGYFMEEEMLCGHGPCSEKEQAEARQKIDEQMHASALWPNAPRPL
jgi:hypothetical protein